MIIADLIKAYINSKFVVTSLQLTILISQHNKKLFKILSKNKVNSFCFITAFNPYSIKTEQDANIKRNQELAHEINDYIVYDGYGQDKDELWEAEISFLVLGITKEQSIKLGKKYGQNAIVFGKIKSNKIIPRLELIDT